MKIQRIAASRLDQLAKPGIVVILYGPRRVGKTTILEDFIASHGAKNTIQFTGDSAVDRDRLSINDQRYLKDLVGNTRYVIVDEAQRIPNIGLTLKLIADWLPHVITIASGSSTFSLAHQTEEPLTGRKRTLTIYPVSYRELSGYRGVFEAKLALERWLIWGSYPLSVTTENDRDRKTWLEELVNGYLYKDLLEFSGVKHAGKIVDLLRLLAYQIGSHVSISELGSQLSMTKETVTHYLDLLEQSFVIKSVRGLSRNLRKELSKSARYYFWDNGVRNALINNFNGLKLRNDTGQLWENFMVIERLKQMEHTGERANVYFWRTHDQKEIDWVEEAGGIFTGFEFKCGKDSMNSSTVKMFYGAYPGSVLHVVNRDNFEKFV